MPGETVAVPVVDTVPVTLPVPPSVALLLTVTLLVIEPFTFNWPASICVGPV